jgi:hypothetical protein
MPPLLHSICALIGTIPIGFGINAFLRPENAITFFNNATMPTVHANIVQALIMIYAARDIFMGVAIYATAFYGSRKALGICMLAGGLNAVIDGVAMKTYMGEFIPCASTLGMKLTGFCRRRRMGPFRILANTAWIGADAGILLDRERLGRNRMFQPWPYAAKNKHKSKYVDHV